MSAHGVDRTVAAILVIALAGIVVGDLSARRAPAQATRAEAPWTHPRTAWGDPDLEGVWTSDNNFAIPLERPADVADKEFLDGTDPSTFEQPWTAVLDLDPQKDIYEYACHEGNRGLENILGAARFEESHAR